MVVAVIKPEKHAALAALTSAALSLPGLNAIAAVPVTKAEGSVEYGHYQESNNRMRVDIYHADGIVPLTDRLELNFSLDRDTYTGASPAYSVPEIMTKDADPGAWWIASGSPGFFQPGDEGWQKAVVNPNPLVYPSNIDKNGNNWYAPNDPVLPLTYYKADVISSASQTTARGLTQEGLEQFAAFQAIASVSDKLTAYRALLNVPIEHSRTKQVFQTQPLETRSQPTVGLKYYFDNTTLALSGGLSDEPDFVSNFGSANLSQELNNKLTTLSLGYSVTGNSIWRNAGHSHAPALTQGNKLPHIISSDCADPSVDCAANPRLDETSIFHSVNFGVSQILGKNTILNAGTSFTHQSGYLSNPYKTVYIRGEITPEEYVAISDAVDNHPVDWNSITQLQIVGPELFREVRPSERNQLSFSTGVNQHIPQLDASLHFDYRFYTDDWKVNSHTFELTWYQSLPYGITVTPGVRYYSQSQAEFFAPYFLAPRADAHYSSDYRLSAFGSLSGSLTLSKQFAKGVKVEAGIEYYTHEGGLKLGGGGSGDYADMSYYLAHGGINVDLSAPGSLFDGSLFGEDEHAHHHHHMHHGSHPPAGVMYAHMLDQAGDVMFGYRYMYNGQAGNMLHGSDAVTDQQVNAFGCPGYRPDASHRGCLVRPADMHMGMHMLDIMYAPTDWLTLMLMPQLMDMDMTFGNDLRQPVKGHVENSEQHLSSDSHSMFAGMQHNVFELSDTIFTAMFKLYDDSSHHFHVGIGGSAPTGSVEIKHGQTAGYDYPNEITILHDIGMMPGSGTWDFKPSVTYTGQYEDFSWGAQFNATKRMQERNKSGYALGDNFQSTVWGGYNIFNWLSASVRGVYTQQDKVKGDLPQYQRLGTGTPTDPYRDGSLIAHNTSSTVDYTQNYGGHYWDIGLGLNLRPPGGGFAGHSLSIEWLQPVKDYVNGYQLERNGAFSATWSYMF